MKKTNSNLGQYLKLVVLTLSMMVLFPTRVHAQQQTLPFYEPFPTNETPGELGAQTGSIWIDGNDPGTGSADINGAAALSYSGLQSTNVSQGLYICPTTSNRNREIGFTPVTSGSLFVSFLLNVQSAPAANSLFAAISSASGGSPGSSAHSIWLTTANQLEISKRSTSTPSAGPTSALTPGTHLVVWSYAFITGSDNDVVSLWLDPSSSTFGAGTPPTATLTTTGSGASDSSQLVSFSICNIAGNTNRMFFDELRIGTSWASVTPPAAAPVATSFAFSTQPRFAAAGAAISPVVVQVVDQYGNAFTSSVPVTLTVGSGTLSGTTSASTSASNGSVTFNNLSVNTPAVEQLTVSGGGLTPATSAYFSILPGGGGGSTAKISQASKSGNNIVFNGNSGSPSQSFNVLSSTNLSTPISQWNVVGSGNFDGSGNFGYTNPISPGSPQQYFVIKYTPSGGGGGGGGTLPAFTEMGYANTNVTGGAAGPTVVVSDYISLSNYCRLDIPITMLINGTITGPGPAVDEYCYMYGPNKSLIGIGTNATLAGIDFFACSTNLIFRNLFFQVPPIGSNDAVSAELSVDNGITNLSGFIWFDHCTIYDGQDGAIDITKGADYVTLSWCEFYYDIIGNAAACHRFPDLIGGADNDGISNDEEGREHVTIHHTWYNTNCLERMPSVRWGRVHVFDNYYSCPGNDYCVRTRLYAQVLAEDNYFSQVNDAFEQYINTSTSVEPANEHGLLNATNNNYQVGCTTNYSYIINNACGNGGTFGSSNSVSITYTSSSGTYEVVNSGIGTDSLSDMSPPPYSYSLDPVSQVPNLVTNYAGNGKILPLP
jgi:pectate lyase